MIYSSLLDSGPLARRPESDRAEGGRSEGTLLHLLAPVSHGSAWELQTRLHAELVQGIGPDTVLIVEHRPVYTLGRSTKRSDWGGDEQVLRKDGAELCTVNRGGSVTYHGPGQIVVYPILTLAHFASGPRQFVRLLEDVIIQVLGQWRIDGQRIAKQPGVWVTGSEPAKIASIGIRVEQGVTLHGFALNVDMDLSPFERIRPCGFIGCRVTSMAEVLKTSLSVDKVKEDLGHMFAQVFGIKWSKIIVRAHAGT